MLGEDAAAEFAYGSVVDRVGACGAVVGDDELFIRHGKKVLEMKTVIKYGLQRSLPREPASTRSSEKKGVPPMDNQEFAAGDEVVAEIEETEQLAHLSASHSNALVENPFD
ncbi:hypothetical protein GCM10023405_39140 [Streptomonospora salina]